MLLKNLNLLGYDNGKGGPNDWMYQQVIEAVAVFASHGNSGGSAPFEINLVQKNNTSLLFLSINYNIQWEECPCMKGVRLEDVTPELEEKALNEIKNNN